MYISPNLSDIKDMYIHFSELNKSINKKLIYHNGFCFNNLSLLLLISLNGIGYKYIALCHARFSILVRV